MTLLLKDPEAMLDYGIDWDSDYLRGADALASSQWRVEPDEPGGIMIAGESFDAAGSNVTLGGGIAGRLYRVVNQVGTALGREDSRSFTVRVEKR